MNPEDIQNRSLALVLWAKDKSGDDDVAVFPGEFLAVDGNYYLRRQGDKKNPKILEEWLSRIAEVPKEQKETLCDCDFFLSLTVGELDSEESSIESFGLKWPE